MEIYRVPTDLEQPGAAKLTDPDHIEVGWKLTIPGATGGAGADYQHHADAPGGDHGEGQGGYQTPPKDERPTQPEVEPTVPA